MTALFIQLWPFESSCDHCHADYLFLHSIYCCYIRSTLTINDLSDLLVRQQNWLVFKSIVSIVGQWFEHLCTRMAISHSSIRPSRAVGAGQTPPTILLGQAVVLCGIQYWTCVLHLCVWLCPCHEYRDSLGCASLKSFVSESFHCQMGIWMVCCCMITMRILFVVLLFRWDPISVVRYWEWGYVKYPISFPLVCSHSLCTSRQLQTTFMLWLFGWPGVSLICVFVCYTISPGRALSNAVSASFRSRQVRYGMAAVHV